MEKKEILKYLENEFLLNDTDLAIDNVADWIQQELDKAREEGRGTIPDGWLPCGYKDCGAWCQNSTALTRHMENIHGLSKLNNK